MAINQSVDLTDIPLCALKQSTLITLSTSLNVPKIIPTVKGLPRDWRGFAQLIGLNAIETNQISAKLNQFSALIDYWGAKGSVSLLQEYLGIIDRYDILDDTKEAIAKDSFEYKERLIKCNTTDKIINAEADKKILTVDDVIRLNKGLNPQIYDAYILYAEEDSDFATEIIETMENKYELKLCVRDRDLIGGVQFEHDAITKLIAERCRRLVVVVSSNFLKSKANKFFVTFAQALGIDIRERKVIPILYERCDVPPELSYYFLLDYNRAGKLWNFWDKLRDSIQAPEISRNLPTEDNLVKMTEPKSDLWISRTHFEDAKREKTVEHSELSSFQSVTEKKPKMGNIYKIIKKSFNKSKRSPVNRESGEKDSKIFTNISACGNESIFDSADDISVENFNSSSSFESKCKCEKERNEKIKKKWYKKKALEPLLS